MYEAGLTNSVLYGILAYILTFKYDDDFKLCGWFYYGGSGIVLLKL